jgi:hypothetical protein
LDLLPGRLDHRFELLRDVLVWLRASVVHRLVEVVCEAEGANEQDHDQQEREEPEEPAVGKRGRVGGHGVLEEETQDRASANLDDPAIVPTAHAFRSVRLARDSR